MTQMVTQIRDLQSGLDESELKYDHLAAAYQSLIQEAGVDESMINSLNRRWRSTRVRQIDIWRTGARRRRSWREKAATLKTHCVRSRQHPS